MKYKQLLITIFLFFLAPQAFAAIYMQEDSNGNTIYSDTPLTTNAQKVVLPKEEENLKAGTVKTLTNPTSKKPPDKTGAIPPQVERKEYKEFFIVSPKEQETIQNQPVISVRVQVEPQLQTGDALQIFVDGKAVGEPQTNTTFQLDKIERGSHTLYAAILDDKKAIIKQTAAITIQVMRPTLNSPARVPNSS